jgi:hypothetical protein
MAVLSIKSTYTLDPPTVKALEVMARRWGVSKSEALRRAIRAAERVADGGEAAPLAALTALQQSVKLTPAKARAWAARGRAERHATSKRRESGA